MLERFLLTVQVRPLFPSDVWRFCYFFLLTVGTQWPPEQKTAPGAQWAGPVISAPPATTEAGNVAGPERDQTKKQPPAHDGRRNKTAPGANQCTGGCQSYAQMGKGLPNCYLVINNLVIYRFVLALSRTILMVLEPAASAGTVKVTVEGDPPP